MRSGAGRRRERGFTLIELMIALLISSLLVIMILSIFARVSFAYREQQQIVGIQKLLSAARGAFDHDAKQAGLQLAQGFSIANDGNNVLRPPVRVVNSATGPDEVGFYYANPERQALVVGPTWSTPAPAPTNTVLTIDLDPGFAVNDLVVISTPLAVPSIIDPTNDASVIEYTACVVQIAAIAGNELTFNEVAPWGRAGNDHCQGTLTEGVTMVFAFVAHYWRIDTTSPARAAMGALQLDPTGALLGIVDGNFQDQGYGVVDLQVATYFYDGDGIDTLDPDVGDGNRDWQSGDFQEAFTNNILVGANFLQPLIMSFSLVARTNANVEGVFTANTPNLVDAVNVDNNTLGDRPSQGLPHLTDPALMGNRIYRHITFQVDLRNTGVGR